MCKKNTIVIISVLIVMLIIIFYYWDVDTKKRKPVKFILACFYTKWCGYSTQLMNTGKWDKVKNFYIKSNYYGEIINITEIDCDEKSEIAAQNQIDAYPTIKLFINNNNKMSEIVYTGKNEPNDIITFTNRYLNKFMVY